jgi:hypothetical protein
MAKRTSRQVEEEEDFAEHESSSVRAGKEQAKMDVVAFVVRLAQSQGKSMPMNSDECFCAMPENQPGPEENGYRIHYDFYVSELREVVTHALNEFVKWLPRLEAAGVNVEPSAVSGDLPHLEN